MSVLGVSGLKRTLQGVSLVTWLEPGEYCTLHYTTSTRAQSTLCHSGCTPSVEFALLSIENE